MIQDICSQIYDNSWVTLISSRNSVAEYVIVWIPVSISFSSENDSILDECLITVSFDQPVQVIWPDQEMIRKCYVISSLERKVVCDPWLTHLPLDKMGAISQTIFSDAFSWMNGFLFWSEFHWTLFLKVQLTITQHWFRSWHGAK